MAPLHSNVCGQVAVTHPGRSASGALGMNQNPKAHLNRAGDLDGSELAPAATTNAPGRRIGGHAGLGQALRVIGWLPNHRVERTATSRLSEAGFGFMNPLGHLPSAPVGGRRSLGSLGTTEARR